MSEDSDATDRLTAAWQARWALEDARIAASIANSESPELTRLRANRDDLKDKLQAQRDANRVLMAQAEVDAATILADAATITAGVDALTDMTAQRDAVQAQLDNLTPVPIVDDQIHPFTENKVT